MAFSQKIRDLKGSLFRDNFRWAHKNYLPRYFYATDVDLALIQDHEPIAIIDYKTGGLDTLTYAECCFYTWMLKQRKLVFILESMNPLSGHFTVRHYNGSRFNPDFITPAPTTLLVVENWKEFRDWEADVRVNYQSLWNEQLPKINHTLDGSLKPF